MHNFGSGMSSRRSLIGRLQGPQREMTERALEKWVSAAIPIHPRGGGLNKSLGEGSQLLNFLLTWSLLMKYKEERDDLQLHMIWVSWCGKWLPRVLETTELGSSGDSHSKTTIQSVCSDYDFNESLGLVLPHRIWSCIFRNVKKCIFFCECILSPQRKGFVLKWKRCCLPHCDLFLRRVSTLLWSGKIPGEGLLR